MQELFLNMDKTLNSYSFITLNVNRLIFSIYNVKCKLSVQYE